MGWFSHISNATQQDLLSKFSDNTQEIVRKLENYYKIEPHNFAYQLRFLEIGEETLQQLQNFIDSIDKNLKPSGNGIFNAIVHAYITKNSQYPEKFDTYIAMQYLNKIKNEDKKTSNIQSTEWFSQKLNEVEKHLERISLVKFQLTKNLKELQGQGGSHLWIDHDFIDPAKETLGASLVQVQDIENRMLVLKATYEDHLG